MSDGTCFTHSTSDDDSQIPPFYYRSAAIQNIHVANLTFYNYNQTGISGKRCTVMDKKTIYLVERTILIDCGAHCI